MEKVNSKFESSIQSLLKAQEPVSIDELRARYQRPAGREGLAATLEDLKLCILEQRDELLGVRQHVDKMLAYLVTIEGKCGQFINRQQQIIQQVRALFV